MNNELNNQGVNNNQNEQNIGSQPNVIEQNNPYITSSSNNIQNNGNNQQPQIKHFVSLIFALINYFVLARFVVTLGLIATIVSKSSFGFYLKLILIFLYLIGTIAWIFIAGWKVCKYNRISKIIYLIVAAILAFMLGKSIYDAFNNNSNNKNISNTPKDNTVNQEVEKEKFNTAVKNAIKLVQMEWMVDSLKDETEHECYISFDDNKDHDYSYECKKIESPQTGPIRYVALISKTGKVTQITAITNDFFVEIKGENIIPETIDKEYYRVNHSINGLIVSKKDDGFIIELDNQLNRDVNR